MDMLRWDYGKNTAGYYYEFENNIRYLKLFLSKRAEFISSKLNIPYSGQYNFNTDDIHTVTMLADDETSYMEVADGDYLVNLPSVEDKGWYYARDGVRVTKYIPVYEDITIKLK